MSIFDQEKNLLPGVTTEVELTFNEDFDTSLWGTTESVLVIGTAFDGPVNKPVRLYSPEYAKFIFGEPYSEVSKKEATLVKEFLDVWDRGGRTVWGVRVSGKPLYKDFQLSSTDEYKLRVSSIFPSNINKNCYFTYNNSIEGHKVRFYKPKERATMAERSRGLIDSMRAMIEFDLDLGLYDINQKSPISEFITRFNNAPRNNIIRLSIVDKDGNDVTNRMDIINEIEVAAIFPGAYFIGRDRNRSYASTDLRYELTSVVDEFGVEKIEAHKDLVLNSDIKKDLPIYARELKMLNKSFIDVGVIMTEMFDFLSNYKTVNKVFQADKNDYEEVDLTDFELYEKLGSGYAVSAVAETRGRPGRDGKTDIKVVEAKLDDPNRIVPIREGIYSTIENLDTDYRILAGGYANKVIRNRMPRKEDFKKAKPNSELIFNETTKITTKVDPNNITANKKYKLILDAFSPEDDITKDILKEGNLYGKQSITHVPELKIDYDEDLNKTDVLKTLAKFNIMRKIEDGAIFLLTKKGEDGKGVLCRKDDKKITVLDKIEMKDKFIYANGSLYVGATEDSEPKEDTVFKAPEGKKFNDPKFMVAGLMNAAGTAQKAATIEEVYEFFKKAQPVYELDENNRPVIKDGKPVQIGERPSVNFKKENIKITEDEVKITGQIFTKADWAKIKSTPNANPDIPYRMTILYGSDKKDKACKLVIGKDGYATIDDLGQHNEGKDENLVPEKPMNKAQRLEFSIAKTVDEEKVFFRECEASEIDEDAKYFIINSNGNINIFASEKDGLTPVGSLRDIISDDEDKTLITIEDVITLPTEFDEGEDIDEISGVKIANKAKENLINITSSAFDYMTLDDLLLFLGEYPALRSKFEFELTKKGVMIKDEYIIEEVEEDEKISNIFFEEKDEEGYPLPTTGTLSEDVIEYARVEYDTNLYIPFKTNDNFARQLAQHCASTSLKTGDTHGIIGVEPLTNVDLNSVAKWVDKLLETEYDLYVKKINGRAALNSRTGEPFDIGDKVSIVVGQYPVMTGMGYRTVSNGVGGYAGMVSDLPLDRSSTNQPINIEMLDFELSNYQLSNLTQKGYVTFKDSYSKGIVVTDGVTAAQSDSPLRRLSSVKILKAVKDLIRRKSEPFIGMRDNITTIASLETAIETDMSKLKGVLLKDYTFYVKTPKASSSLGIIDVFFSIIPYNEIRNINSKIRVVDEISDTTRN